MKAKDFREYPRVEVDWEIFFTSLDHSEELKIKGKITNISAGGVFIKSKLFIFKENTIIKVIIKIPEKDNEKEKEIQTRGKVVHYRINDEKSGMGVRFIDISEQDKDLINKYVQNHFPHY